MNRRELLQSVAAVATGAGMSAPLVSTVEAAQPGTLAKPALLLIECDHPISHDASRNIVAQLSDALKGSPFADVKALVLGDGLRLTMLDANGQVLNRRLDDLVA